MALRPKKPCNKPGFDYAAFGLLESLVIKTVELP